MSLPSWYPFLHHVCQPALPSRADKLTLAQSKLTMKTTLLAMLATTALLGCVAPPRFTAPIDPYAPLQKESIFYAEQLAQAGQQAFDALGAEAFVLQSQNHVQEDLKDPESARFRKVELRSFSNGKLVCGELNAKNSYGGYEGYKKFIATPQQVIFAAEPMAQHANPIAAQSAINAGIRTACE